MPQPLSLAAILLAGLAAAPALAQDMTPDTVDVVEAASANPNLEAFLQATTDAELAEAIATAPAVTVFAPINEAFEAVEDLATLQADPAALAAVLELHVVPTAYLSGDIPEGVTEVETLAGETLTLTNEDGQISVTSPSGVEAMVVEADIEGDNGVVHAINTVLTP
jgi:uncharacterized surface protein with fasciclin (FAS1) repeats